MPAKPLSHSRRLQVLAAAGVPAELRGATAAWNAQAISASPVEFPAEDEPHAARWQKLLTAGGPSTAALLATAYPVLADHPPAGSIQINLTPTPAGRIPVITTADRTDFTWLLRTLWYAGRPVEIPATVGAMYLSGVLQNGPDSPRDRLILLSQGGYAGLTGARTGFEEGQWLAHSMAIRRAHELTHYVLHRLRGRPAKNLTEEIIADAEGLRAATGHCPAPLAKQILGVASSVPEPGARFSYYVPPRLHPAIPALHHLLSAACDELADPRWDLMPASLRLRALASLSLEDLAASRISMPPDPGWNGDI